MKANKSACMSACIEDMAFKKPQIEEEAEEEKIIRLGVYVKI